MDLPRRAQCTRPIIVETRNASIDHRQAPDSRGPWARFGETFPLPLLRSKLFELVKALAEESVQTDEVQQWRTRVFSWQTINNR